VIAGKESLRILFRIFLLQSLSVSLAADVKLLDRAQ